MVRQAHHLEPSREMKLSGIRVLRNILLCCFVFNGLFAGLCMADRIILKQGHVLTGDILAEKQNQLVLDIGVEVLVIPKDKVLEYEYTDSYQLDNEPNLVPKHSSSSDRLYSVSDKPKTTMEKCVDLVSEAVVKVSTPAGLGSGFFINPDGYLITNNHVIEKETKIEVTVFIKAKDGFEKKKCKKIKIEAINPFVDLALLKVEDIGDLKITYVPLSDISRVKVGEQVFAVGNPLGLERTVTNGVISTLNRPFEGLVYLQTNADINPGNSGGPLFNLAGEVVGVTNMGYIFLGGLGFAVPVDYVRHFLDNRQAFAYDKDNPNTGYRYLQPDGRKNNQNPDVSEKVE